MTLADGKVRKLLQRDFVATWGNVAGDPSAGSSYAHAPDDATGSCIRGNGEHNIQILAMTPQGELLGVTAGFLSADDLREELTAMRDLDMALQRASRTEQLSDEDREQLVRDTHERMLEALAEREFDGPLGDWEQRRALADHRFSGRRALRPAREFRAVDLLGNSRTFFGTSSGEPPTGRIGTGPQTPAKPPRSAPRTAGR